MEKWIAYQRLPTLKEYALVYQEKISVEMFRRVGDGWEKEIYTEGDIEEFSTLPFSIKIERIYEDVLKFLSDK